MPEFGEWNFPKRKNGVYFSELSPRPHDTGMVTLAETQNLNEFELHARAVLGLPIPEIELLKIGASAVVLAPEEMQNSHLKELKKFWRVRKQISVSSVNQLQENIGVWE